MLSDADLKEFQRELCARFAVSPRYVMSDENLGVSLGVWRREWPLNGLRISADEGTSGWFVWSGTTMSEKDDFFEPHHVGHLLAKLPEVGRFLGLPRGWRFLLAPGYEDVWYDDKLLESAKDE